LANASGKTFKTANTSKTPAHSASATVKQTTATKAATKRPARRSAPGPLETPARQSIPSESDVTPHPNIRVGIGGWTYPEWRGVFYPPGLRQSDELQYASRQVTAIEINGTYYGTQKPESFAAWRDATPDNFIFSVKASRYATNRRVLAEAGESIERFLDSGIAELGPKLGPILWEFARTKKFDPNDFEAFLRLLPGQLGQLPLRHVLDVRHESFANPEFLALARQYKVACVYTDASDLPSFADRTADFIYARFMEARSENEHGYSNEALDRIAAHAQAWAAGKPPAELPYVDAAHQAKFGGASDVFLYMINGAKERAPAAATALLGRL